MLTSLACVSDQQHSGARQRPVPGTFPTQAPGTGSNFRGGEPERGYREPQEISERPATILCASATRVAIALIVALPEGLAVLDLVAIT